MGSTPIDDYSTPFYALLHPSTPFYTLLHPSVPSDNHPHHPIPSTIYYLLLIHPIPSTIYYLLLLYPIAFVDKLSVDEGWRVGQIQGR